MEISVVEGPGFAGALGSQGGMHGIPGAPGAPSEQQSAAARSRETAQFSALLTAASRDYPRGDLQMDTIEWDLQRITDAGARLMDRGGQQLTGVARVTSDDGENIIVCLLYTSPSPRDS